MSTVTVCNPRVAEVDACAPLAPALAKLKGARIAFVDNSKVNADLFLGRLKPLLEKVYGAKPGETVRKLAPKDELSAEDLAKLKRYDGVIQCFGD
jgi:hypothetical protein